MVAPAFGVAPKSTVPVPHLVAGTVAVTSFAKVIVRILKKYIPEGEITNTPCPECGENSIIYQEGCKSCQNCGYSAC